MKFLYIVLFSLILGIFDTQGVFAQITTLSTQQGLSTFASLISTFNNTIVKALATLFMSGAVVAFFFGIVKFIWGMREGDAKTVTNGKQFMIWALIALFTMFSVYGIIKFFQRIVPGLDQSTITIPDIIFGGSSQGSNTGANPLSPGSNTGGNTSTTGVNTGGKSTGSGTGGGVTSSGASTGASSQGSKTGVTSCTTVNAEGQIVACTVSCGVGLVPDSNGACTTPPRGE